MPQLIDLVGCIFGELTVLSRVADCGNVVKWKCQCTCGNIKDVDGANLRYGKTKSCGCRQGLTKHNMSRTAIYKAWHGMLQRCQNKSHSAYQYYGGRGITVCDQWKTFDGFYADMGDRPPKMTLDRIDNDGPYSPENCRWVSHADNCSHTRKTHRCIVDGIEYKTFAEAGRALGKNANTIRLWCCGGINNGDCKYKEPRPGCYLPPALHGDERMSA